MFKIEFDPETLFQVLQQENITKEEWREALTEVKRLCLLARPEADTTIEPIEATLRQWHRQKPEGANYRTILQFDWSRSVIIIHAVIQRDANTYRRVKTLFDSA